MKNMQFLFCLGVVMISATPALAKPAYVAATVNLRAAPGLKSEVVVKIPGGSLVDAGECTEGWCTVTWQEKSGFAIQTSLDMSGRIPQRAADRPPGYARSAGPAYGPNDGYVPVDEPVYYGPPRAYYYGGPYYRPYWGWRRGWW